MRNNRENYIDDDFQHTYSNVAKDLSENKGIEWRRVSSIIKKAVYALPTIKEHELVNSDFKSNNRALETCLILISRTHPRKLQRIRSQRTKDEGLY